MANEKTPHLDRPLPGDVAQPQPTMNERFIDWARSKAGILAFSLAGADRTITADEAVYGVLRATGVLAANRAILVPEGVAEDATAKSNIYLVWNDTSGAYTVTVKTPTGTGGTVEQGDLALAISDGTNVYVFPIGITGAPSTGITITQAQDEFSPAFTTLTDGATITWDFLAKRSLNARVTLGGNRTLSMPNLVNGATGILVVTQDATGSRTLTLPAGSLQNGGGGTAANIETAANATTILSFVYDGTSLFWTQSGAFS
jgi:hypothetical protein